MSHVFSGKAAIPGLDDEIGIVGELPEFASALGQADSVAQDCRMPERAQLPGQGRRPDKILAALGDRLWYRRNQGMGKVDGGYTVKGGIATASGRPVLGVSQSFWEKKYADTEKKRLPKLDKVEHFEGCYTVLPVSISARYYNYFHFVTEFMALAPATRDLMQIPEYQRLVVTIPKPEQGSFQHGLLAAWFGDVYDDIIFNQGMMRADSLAFPIDRCRYYHHVAETGEIQSRMPEDAWRGMAGVLSTGLQTVYKTLSDRAPRRKDAPQILIISRERAGRRRIVNEKALVEALAPFGARTVVLEDYSVEEQISIVSSTEILIGCHGAGMINAGFMKPGAMAIELSSRQYLPRADDFVGQSALCDIAYRVILCDEDGEFTKDHKLESNIGNDILLTDPTIDHVLGMCRQHLSERKRGTA